MKILMLLTELAPGGAEKVVLELARGFRRRHHDVAVVSLKPEPPEQRRAVPDGLQECGAEIFYLNLSGFRLWRLLRLFSIYRKFRPDVVHAHLMHPNLLSRFLKLFFHIPLVNTIHIAERRSGKNLFFLADRLTRFLCDSYTAVSVAAARFQEDRCGLQPGSIRVIYNGSDPVEAAPKELMDSLRRDWNLDSCARIIGSVGRLDRQKGYDLFLNLLPRMEPFFPEGGTFGIVILGDGPEREKLLGLAEDVNRNHPRFRVVLPGYRRDAASLIGMFDVFVMPSRYEGYGLTLTEAFSAGVPAVCNSVDSLPELCSLVPDHSFLVDFRKDEPETIASVLLTAAQIPHFPGKTIMTTDAMCSAYLSCYASLLPSSR